MNIAIIIANYNFNLMLAMMLTYEQHQPVAYGLLEKFAEERERSFELIIYKPDPQPGAAERLRLLARIRTETRRIIITEQEEVLFMARQYTLVQSLLIPFSRKLFIAVVDSKNFQEEQAREIKDDHEREIREQQQHGS
jgi:hypothetical protein